MQRYKKRIQQARVKHRSNPLSNIGNRSEPLLEVTKSSQVIRNAQRPRFKTLCLDSSNLKHDEYQLAKESPSTHPDFYNRTHDAYQLALDSRPQRKFFSRFVNRMSTHPNHPGVPAGQPPPGVATATNGAVPDSYFTETKKGEVNELRNLLRNFPTERDVQRKRDIIKKVIAYMTLGIDVSRLFTDMMLAIETRDLVIKKMVYLFLCNYATSHPDLAQMCTNTLVKDCGNDDPMVRGLALRALCSLRLPQMVEYISEPLSRSLTDGHAYVRKTGVMGILKLYDLDKETFERCNFVDILYDMLRDPDASVVSNCIIVLNEIMSKGPNGGMAINRAIMLHLLNRIHEFSEFGIVQVLELVPRYIPANEEEGFQIMNLLDPVLRTSNSGAVLATIRAFLSLAETIGDDTDAMTRQVVGRIKASIITLVASGSAELVYCLLKHVDALVDLCPGVFDDEYRQFYVRYHEPTHTKYLKIDILPKLTNPESAPDIVAELAETVADVDENMSRFAVRSMTRIACRNTGGPGCAESIAKRLVEMLDLNVAHVCSEAATALTHIIRKHPSLRTLIAPPLPRSLRYVTEPTGKASIVYLLGECGDIVSEAPYALEKLIDTYDELTDASVKIALLTSTVKLFFVRPPEVQRMLGQLLRKATEDVSSQDLHDRALMYYRLLKNSGNPIVVDGVVKTSAVIPESINFSEEEDSELRDALMEEFNTLSIMYGKTSENFVDEEFQVNYVKMPPEHPLAPGDSAAAAPIPPTNDIFGGESSVAAAPAAPPAVAPAPVSDVVDLLGFGDPAPSLPPADSAGAFRLVPSFVLGGEEYESKWVAVADSEAVVTMATLKAMPPSSDVVEQALGEKHIMTMASGELEAEFKFFLYAQDSVSGTVFLIQSNINKESGEALMILTIKTSGGDSSSSNQEKVDLLMEIVSAALAY